MLLVQVGATALVVKLPALSWFRWLEEAIRLCPEDAAIVDEAGEGYRLLGKDKQALQLFIEAGLYTNRESTFFWFWGLL